VDSDTVVVPEFVRMPDRPAAIILANKVRYVQTHSTQHKTYEPRAIKTMLR
jgi:hypothetical protein